MANSRKTKEEEKKKKKKKKMIMMMVIKYSRSRIRYEEVVKCWGVDIEEGTDEHVYRKKKIKDDEKVFSVSMSTWSEAGKQIENELLEATNEFRPESRDEMSAWHVLPTQSVVRATPFVLLFLGRPEEHGFTQEAHFLHVTLPVCLLHRL